MNLSPRILATAGHVDHGKSALVKALTGTDPDRLPEEKARGITIDLGFAFLDLSTPTHRFEVGIIDVPGHEDFIKNMVAGMAAIDAALLVVAVDDGWMPQTQEHLEILSYLGVAHAVVAITKCDMAGAEAVAEAVRRRLHGTPLAHAAIVMTSAKTGQGIHELKAALTAMLERTPPPRDIGKARLSVDRVFSLRGIGTVVTGTLVGGTVTRGQSLWVEPAGKVTRARTLQTHGRDVTHALPGMRTAINLPDVTSVEVKRGDVVVGKKGTAVRSIVSALWRHREKGVETVLLREGARVHVHVGSAECAARVQWAKGSGGAATTIAQLRLEGPVFVVLGDRFVMRDWAARETVAGGIIVDVEPGRGWHRRADDLLHRSIHVSDVAVWVETQVRWDLAVAEGTLLEQSRFSSAEVQAVVETLAKAGKVARAGEFVVEAAWWARVQQGVTGAVQAHHQARPQDTGMPLAMVQEFARQGEGGRRLKGKLWEALVGKLGGAGLVTAGTYLKREGHAPALPAGLQRAGDAIRAALRGRPFDPPSKKELIQAAGASGREAMTFLLTAGEVVALGEEGAMSSEAVDEAGRRVKAFLTERGRGTVSEIKAMLGTSRRIAVPLLECLDERGVTLRRGDVRVVGAAGKPDSPTEPSAH